MAGDRAHRDLGGRRAAGSRTGAAARRGRFCPQTGRARVAQAGDRSCAAGAGVSRTGSLEGRPDDTELAHFRRSEEHTSELQSRLHLVCRLLLEKKKNTKIMT